MATAPEHTLLGSDSVSVTITGVEPSAASVLSQALAP